MGGARLPGWVEEASERGWTTASRRNQAITSQSRLLSDGTALGASRKYNQYTLAVGLRNGEVK